MGRRNTSVRTGLLRAAENRFREGHHQAALERYARILRTCPGWSHAEHASMMVGLCLERMGQIDDAIRALEETVQAFPDRKGFSDVTWLYLAGAYLQQGRVERATAALEKSIALSEGVRRHGQFPLGEARRRLAELKAP